MDINEKARKYDDFISLGAKECLSFAKANFKCRLNWGRVAESAEVIAANFIVGDEVSDEGLEWLRLAVYLFERIADEVKNDKEVVEKNIVSGILNRCLAIRVWGAMQGDSVRDIKDLLRNFKLLVTVSPQEILKNEGIPFSNEFRIIFLLIRFFDPLLKKDELREELEEIFQYKSAMETVRERNGMRKIIP